MGWVRDWKGRRVRVWRERVGNMREGLGELRIIGIESGIRGDWVR